MGEVRPIPTFGGVVRDVRGAGRALRVSWHREDGLVVLSLWDGARCTGTVRVAAADVPALVEALQIGLHADPVTEPAGGLGLHADLVAEPAEGAGPVAAPVTHPRPEDGVAG